MAEGWAQDWERLLGEMVQHSLYTAVPPLGHTQDEVRQGRSKAAGQEGANYMTVWGTTVQAEGTAQAKTLRQGPVLEEQKRCSCGSSGGVAVRRVWDGFRRAQGP